MRGYTGVCVDVVRQVLQHAMVHSRQLTLIKVSGEGARSGVRSPSSTNAMMARLDYRGDYWMYDIHDVHSMTWRCEEGALRLIVRLLLWGLIVEDELLKHETERKLDILMTSYPTFATQTRSTTTPPY